MLARSVHTTGPASTSSGKETVMGRIVSQRGLARPTSDVGTRREPDRIGVRGPAGAAWAEAVR